jgi:hypothetical protein
MKKTNGATWQKFYNDPEVWKNGAFHDSEEILCNGKPFDTDDIESLEPTDQITILSGVFYPTEQYEDGTSLVTVFKNWEKKQSEEILVVSIPKAKAEEIKKALATFGAKVIK